MPTNLNVFATTASNATTSSFACYFDESRKTFLADVYSIKWMQDSDKNNIEKETLEQQYRVVKRETNTSTVIHLPVSLCSCSLCRSASLETSVLARRL